MGTFGGGGSKGSEKAARRAQTHLKEHLQLQGGEAVAFLDPRIPLEEGPRRHSAADPLDGNHLAVGGDEGRVRVPLHEGRLDACSTEQPPANRALREPERRSYRHPRAGQMCLSHYAKSAFKSQDGAQERRVVFTYRRLPPGGESLMTRPRFHGDATVTQ